jgi:hypothetical protein
MHFRWKRRTEPQASTGELKGKPPGENKRPQDSAYDL